MQEIFEHILIIIKAYREDNQWQRIIFRLCQIGLQLACSFHEQLEAESIEELLSLISKLIKKQQLFRKEIEVLLALSLQCAEHMKANFLLTDYHELKILSKSWKLSPNHVFAELTAYSHLLANTDKHQAERWEQFKRHEQTLREALQNETKLEASKFSQLLNKLELKFVCEVIQSYAIARFHETTKHDVIKAILHWQKQSVLIRHLLEIVWESLASCRGRNYEEFTHTWEVLSPFVETLMQDHPALVLSLFAIRIDQAQRLKASDLLTTSWDVIIPQLETLLSNLKVPTYDTPLAWWQIYRTELKKARNAFYMAEQTNKNLELAQEEYTEACCNLVKRMWKNNVSLLGEPPCAMEFIVLGSMSRGDMLPYSDCEAMLLLKEAPSSAEIAAYLQLQAWLLNYHMLSLGEDPNIQSLHVGFHVDKALNWLGSAASDLSDFVNNHFIQRPEVEVLPNYHTAKATIQPELLYQDIAYFSLLQPKSILGAQTLLAMYQSNLNTWLSQPATVEAKKLLKLPSQLALTWKAFMCLGQWHKVKFIEPMEKINIKDFARPLVVWANTLRLWYDIKATHPVKIFQTLENLIQSHKKESSVWSIALIRLARIALQRLNEIRFFVQKENQSQYEIIKQAPGDENFFPMSPEIRQELSCIHKMVLVPWQTAINAYFNLLTNLPDQRIVQTVPDIADRSLAIELPGFLGSLFQALSTQTEVGLSLGIKIIQYLLNEPIEVSVQPPVVSELLQGYYTALQQLLDKTLDLLPDNCQNIHSWLQTVSAFFFKPKASECHSAFSELVQEGIVEPFYKGYQTQLEKLNDSQASLNSAEWLNLLQTSYIRYLNYREDWYKRWHSKKVDASLLLTHPLVTVCGQKPASNGWSTYHEYRKQTWYSKLTKLFTLPNEQLTATGTCTIAGYPLTAFQPNADVTYVLPIEITEQLFDTKSGKVRGDPLYSSPIKKSSLLNFFKKMPSSQVHRLKNYGDIDVFFKVKEGNRECLLGREIAVSCLHQLLGGTLAIAPGWPVCLTYITPKNKVNTYWAWVSETVDGEPLGDVMQKNDLDTITIDPVSYSQLFILALLIFPEDGQPWNFILQQQKAGSNNYRLIAIDNGQSFVNPWEPSQQTDQVGILNLKSMIFFLPNIQQPLAAEVIEELLLLDVEVVIENWKSQLTTINEQFKALLEKQLAAARVNLVDWPLYNALIDVTGKQIDFNFIKLRLLMIQAWLRKHQTATAMELFQYIDPLIAATYQSYYVTIKSPKDYYQLNPKAYMIRPTVEKIQQANYQASSRHYSDLLSNTLCMDYLQKDSQAQKNIIEFLSTISWKDLPEKQQKFFLEIMSRISFTEKLNLAGCTVLDDNRLKNILKKSPELKEISLKDCPAVTNKSWIIVGKLCKKIIVIDVRNTPGITKLEKVYFGFDELRTLYSSLSKEAMGISLKKIGLVNTKKTFNYEVEVLLVGYDIAAGKSSCIQRFCKDTYKGNIKRTIGIDFEVKYLELDGKSVKAKIIEQPGERRLGSEKFFYKFYRGIYIFVMDITNRISLDLMRRDIKWIREYIRDIPILFVANKCDLEEQRQFTYEEGLQLALEVSAFYYIECSAKEATNVEAAFTLAIRAAVDYYYKELDPFEIYKMLEQPEHEAIQNFISINSMDHPWIWYFLKTAINKLDDIHDNLIIMTLHQGLASNHYFIRQTAAELLIQFKLFDNEDNQAMLVALERNLFDKKAPIDVRQEAAKKIEQIGQFNNPYLINVLFQGVESNNAQQRQFAAEALINLRKFEAFETKILYALGRNLADRQVEKASEILLQQLNKLIDFEVGKGLTDEINISNEVSLYAISKVIKYGHFLTYSQQIIDRLSNQYDEKEAKNLLQKILDENLYRDDVKLKEQIEAALEAKFLYNLGKNLANVKTSIVTEEILLRINKLTSFEVGKGLIDELDLSKGISLYKVSTIIKYGHFTTYSQEITNMLIKKLESYNEKWTKDILQKVLDKHLYGDDVKLKNHIEAVILIYKMNQAAYQILAIGRMIYQLHTCAPSNHPLHLFNNEIIHRILQQIPEMQRLSENEQKSIMNYARDKKTLLLKHNMQQFLQAIDCVRVSDSTTDNSNQQIVLNKYAPK